MDDVREEKMRRYLYIGNINDKRPAKYMCSVCSNIGCSVERPSVDLNSYEICRCCGYPWGTTHDKNAWFDAWLQSGAKKLFDLPLDERRDYMDVIQEKYIKHFYHLPDEQEKASLVLDERTYSQNGFEKIRRPNKKIVVRFAGNEKKYDFETNKIHRIDGEKSYFDVIVKDDHAYLLLSHEFQYNGSVIRWSFVGLMPDVFYISMDLEAGCEVYDNNGVKYLFTIEEAN